MGTMILANIAAQMVMPLESLYVQELGADVSQVGLFFTIAAIAPLMFQVFGGWLSDSIGRLQAIAIGSVGGALSYLFYIFAHSWIWLLPASILTAMAIAFVAPSFQAFVAEESTEKTRGRVYGITSTMFMVVNIIGPLLGGVVAQGLSFKAMYIAAGSLYATAAFIRVLMARRASRQRRESGESAQKPSLSGFKKSLAAVLGLVLAGGVVTWIFISDGVRDIAFSLTSRLMPLYLDNEMGLSLLQISALQSITAVVAMALMSPAGWLSDKKGERVGIVGGFGLICIGWYVFLIGGSFWHFVISRVIIGGGWALIEPAYSSLISKAVPDKLRGTAFGLFSTSLGLISLPAPWIGARLWESISPIFPFYIPLIAMLAMLPVMWIKFKLPPDAGEETQETAGKRVGASADTGQAAN
jgi:DHA1 family multidrug resistance protein-like MFS transporter